MNLPLDLQHRHIYTRHQLKKNGLLLHRHILALLVASMHLPESNHKYGFGPKLSEVFRQKVINFEFRFQDSI